MGKDFKRAPSTISATKNAVCTLARPQQSGVPTNFYGCGWVLSLAFDQDGKTGAFLSTPGQGNRYKSQPLVARGLPQNNGPWQALKAPPQTLWD